MVVLGDLGELLRMRHGIGAVPQLGVVAPERPGSAGRAAGRAPRDPARDVAGAPAAASPASRRRGPRARRPPGPLAARYDFPARRLHDDLPVPADVAVLRFSGSFDAPGTVRPQRVRGAGFEMGDEEFRAAYRALPGGKHPDLLALHRACRPAEGPAHAGGPRPARSPTSTAGRGASDEAVEVLAPGRGGPAGRAAPPGDARPVPDGAARATTRRRASAARGRLPRPRSPRLRASSPGWPGWLRPGRGRARLRPPRAWTPTPRTPGCHAWYVRTRPDSAARPEPAPAAEQLAHVALFAEGRENAERQGPAGGRAPVLRHGHRPAPLVRAAGAPAGRRGGPGAAERTARR